MAQSGRHYTVTGHCSFPTPTQDRIPVAIGGNGRSLLELAANEADIVGFTGFFAGEDGRARSFPHFTAPGLANRVEIVRGAAGPRLGQIELNVLVQAVNSDNPRQAAEALANGSRLTAEDVLASPFVLLGSVAAMEEKLLDLRERLGISYATVFGPAMETMAPLVARLAGR